jgi:hypothetical protein
MRVQDLPKALEKLATSDRITIVIGRQPDDKMRVTSASWDGEKVFQRDQVLEVHYASADSRRSGGARRVVEISRFATCV